jgi:hypothetical protein
MINAILLETLTYKKKAPQPKDGGGGLRGNVIQEANKLFVYPLIFYHFVRFFIDSSHNKKIATKDRTLVAIVLCIKQLPEYLYQ